jgi:hypothetical protein
VRPRESNYCTKSISLEEAVSRGLKYFFTGVPCVNGHIAPRFVKGASHKCVECNKAVCRRVAEKRHLIACAECGKEHLAARAKVRYCSRGCASKAYDYNRRRKAEAAEKKLARKQSIEFDRQRSCRVCSSMFLANSTSQRYCSNQCRAASYQQRVDEQNLVRYQAKYGKERSCKLCRRTFWPDPKTRRKLFCSNHCLDNWWTDFRRRRKRAGNAESYSRFDIFERDKWTCQLCHEKIPKRKKFPHPLSATIDHIISIKEGGEDSSRNVQTAHLCCNSRKCAKSRGQLRLF